MKSYVTLSFLLVLGLAMAQAAPEVARSTLPTEKKSAPAVDPSPVSEPKPEVTEKTSPLTGSPSPRVARQPEVVESAAPIEVEQAEESKVADRTKKSASTTFCVEIRPGPSEAPVKVCENPPTPPPPVPQQAHEQHPPPTYVHEPEAPIYIVPSFSQPEVYLQNDPCPPQNLPYHQPVSHVPHIFHHHPPPRPQMVVPQAPCPPEPCPPTCTCARHPHATIALYRSAMPPMDGEQIDGTQMRSSVPETSGLEAEAISAGLENGSEPRSENREGPSPRTFLRRHYGLPLYHQSIFGHRYPHLVHYHPHLVPLGFGRSADGTSGLDGSTQPMMAVDGQPAMEMPQQARTLLHPYVNPAVGYQSHQVYQSYQSPPVPYSSGQHSVYPGYGVHHQLPGIVLPTVSVHSHPGTVTPGSFHIYRSSQQTAQPKKSDEQQPQQQLQERSWNPSNDARGSIDQKNRSEQSAAISPSQMLNRMRGTDGSLTFDRRPVMQTFPRINEERSGNDNGLSVNMNFPRGGQPFMISGARMNGIEEKKFKSGDCGHDENEKRDAQKSASDRDD